MSGVRGSHRVEVEAPPTACAALVIDVERYPQWYETLDAARVLERDGEGRPVLAACEAGAGPLGRIALTLRFTHELPARVRAVQVGGDGRIERVQMEWTFEALDEGRTRVGYSFAAEARGRATQLALRAAGPLVERDLVRAPAEALKRTVEAASA